MERLGGGYVAFDDYVLRCGKPRQQFNEQQIRDVASLFVILNQRIFKPVF